MRILIRLALLATIALGGVFAQLPGALAADYTVIVDKLKFGALPAELHPGDVIIWQNDDILRHSATARDKSFDVDLPAKTSARMTVGAAGSVDFFCKFHPGMKGTLVIAP
jgi:plastocyanin